MSRLNATLSEIQKPRATLSAPKLADYLDSKGLLPEDVAEAAEMHVEHVYEILEGKPFPAAVIHRVASAVGATSREVGAREGESFTEARRRFSDPSISDSSISGGPPGPSGG